MKSWNNETLANASLYGVREAEFVSATKEQGCSNPASFYILILIRSPDIMFEAVLKMSDSIG